MKFNLVLATDIMGSLAKNNKLPWKLEKEMKFFSELTKFVPNPLFTNSVIMGRKTFETLNKPLKDRINIVITSKDFKDNNQEKLYFVKDLDSGLFLAEKLGSFQTFIIGGLSIYHQALLHPNLGEIYWNTINHDFQGDLKINLANFKLQNYGYLTDNGLDIKFNKATIKHPEYQYLQLLNKILLQGEKRMTRNGYTLSLFSQEMTFDLSYGFPLLTTKKMFWKGIVEELLFFLRGHTNSKLLEEKGVNIWKGNTSKEFIEKCGLPYQEGDIGEMYGYNWRHFGAEYIDCHTDYTGKGFDQLKKVIEEIKSDPHSRRILMTDFNPATAHKGVLYPCHSIILQFYLSEGNKLNVKMYQR
jgi:dihydrofolate reductase/thymidylate synthase